MPSDEAKEQASKILGLNKETELLHSFVRIGTGADDSKHKSKSRKKPGDDRKQSSFDGHNEDHRDSPKHAPTKVLSAKQIYNQIKKEMKEKELKSRRIYREEEVYTDKDRAAAVNMGSIDIKNSLSMKMKQDRTKALKLPDEADPVTLMALGRNELRAGNTQIALNFFTKALDLNPDNKLALVARSKCYLLIGEPKLAYNDAETALQIDKNYIKAIYQKAEALYFLGDFELSLMFYHRGLRIRPELEGFRLGVQKAQEAIENTIGSSQPLVDLKDLGDSPMTSPLGNEKDTKKSITPTSKSTTSKKLDSDKKLSRQLLGELSVDKEYLEKLLKHPDLNVGDRRSNNIAVHAEEAIQFLNKRQEFWRQQRPVGGGKRNNKIKDITPLPKWFNQNKML